MEEAYVLRQDQGAVCTLTLNRPGQYNALSVAMISALQEQLATVAKDTNVRVVILAAAGKAFCAGHDLKEMRSTDEKSFQQALFKQCGQLMMTLTEMPQPVIARVHGIATAAGCQLVSMCDLAVSADVAKFAVSGINLGLFCATPSVGLVRNMGRKQAFEMLITGDFINAEEAKQRGLVNRVVPLNDLDAEIACLSASIAAKAPQAVAMGKRLFYQQVEMGMAAAYQLAAEVMACNMDTVNAKEGIDAFLEKRKPVFTE